jgi:hypothetical protein
MLLLPETALLDTGLAGDIREYVRNGGTLLAFGHASLFDEMARQRNNSMLNDVFGVDLAGYLPGYKQFVRGSEIASSLRLNPPAVAVKPTTGKVLATWASAGDTPAIIENRFGKGKVIYVSAAENAFSNSSSMLEELAGRLIGPSPVAVLSSREYVMVASRKGNDLLIYLLNRSTGSRANTDTELTKSSAFAGPEEVTLQIDTSIILASGATNGRGASMSSERREGRREFMMASAAGVAAGVMPACQAATVQDLEAAVAMVGRLPRRKLGRGDREVSVLVGAATWSREAVEAGIRCVVNFWHAAHEWDRGNVPPAILKDRDTHYCQVCVDRAHGNHERGRIAEEADYRSVKQARNKQTNRVNTFLYIENFA